MAKSLTVEERIRLIEEQKSSPRFFGLVEELANELGFRLVSEYDEADLKTGLVIPFSDIVPAGRNSDFNSFRRTRILQCQQPGHVYSISARANYDDRDSFVNGAYSLTLITSDSLLGLDSTGREILKYAELGKIFPVENKQRQCLILVALAKDKIVKLGGHSYSISLNQLYEATKIKKN